MGRLLPPLSCANTGNLGRLGWIRLGFEWEMTEPEGAAKFILRPGTPARRSQGWGETTQGSLWETFTRPYQTGFFRGKPVVAIPTSHPPPKTGRQSNCSAARPVHQLMSPINPVPTPRSGRPKPEARIHRPRRPAGRARRNSGSGRRPDPDPVPKSVPHPWRIPVPARPAGR